MPRFLRLLAVAVPLILGACGSDNATAPEPPSIEGTTFAASLGVDLAAMTKTASGLYLRDLTVGTDTAVAAAGRTVTVSYVGAFPDGTQFDDGAFSFPLGAGKVIAGFDEGVTGMRVGGKRQLVIPPALAYGSQGYRGIPPNAILVFTVEVAGVQ
ncbi:MAG: FKBP-type peptidyl-prolyl cis-trans isomerase [Gemmatimonadaceae bacterium]